MLSITMENFDNMYREQILDHNQHPRNFGTLEHATVHHHEYNPLCGDKIDLFLQIENDTVTDVKFHGNGCAISTASASMLTEQIKGKPLEEIKKIRKEDIFEMLGVTLSPVRIKCALLAFDTLKNSILIYEEYVR